MLRVFIKGYWSSVERVSVNDSLVFMLIEDALGCGLKFVTKESDAELIILFPFLTQSEKIKMKLLSALNPTGGTSKINRALGFKQNVAMLAISGENLDYPSWRWFGKFIRLFDIPRLTFWPTEIDPGGCRFPYWWNYVAFDGYELNPKVYERFGRPLDLGVLLNPLDPGSSNRSDAICVLTRHQRWPRNNEIAYLKKFKPVHVYQKGTDKTWEGSKFDLLSQYKYAFCAENSTGYGYQTEKLPEAWVAGAIPVGFSPNPYSDFSYIKGRELFCESFDSSDIPPLLSERPNLVNVKTYLRERLSDLLS